LGTGGPAERPRIPARKRCGNDDFGGVPYL
jgi:hypothetical protein